MQLLDGDKTAQPQDTSEDTPSPFADDSHRSTDDDTVDDQTPNAQVERRRTKRHISSQPPPSAFKRTLLYVACTVMFWLLIRHFTKPAKPKIIYASRYSKDYRFRPAASPIITETLKDGRTRLRGTYPTPEPIPDSAKQVLAKNTKRRKRRAKRKSKLAKSKPSKR
ncbi:hypothetical protein HGRIS_000732 [Hohenbuehelia grisea]|uniref:Transmembrane protein n=1 Tax=Hohenbuehelia grisea TaxID=104357 RepID=A0ABR3IPK0_9AGAR